MADHRLTDELAIRLADIATRAGNAILAVRMGGYAVAHKADASPVTEADARAEEIILAGLSEIGEDVQIIAEEAVSTAGLPPAADRFFLVDPLDGTREFIDGRAEFTVNIALVDSGRAVAGVVLAPALETMAVACAQGAFETRLRDGTSAASASWTRLHTRPVPSSGPVALASRSHRDPQTEAFLAARDVAEIRSAGSSLKFIEIARGNADLYPRFGRTMEWDTAAGHAVLSAAGGAVITADGSDLTYGKHGRDYDNPPFVAWGRRPADGLF
jgi:3'(2'), 5'-bisphosphate nucleotidase